MDFFFNYKKDVESINTVVDVTAGHSFQDFYLESNRSETDAGVMIERPMNIENNALESYFARASFDIADKYLVSLSYDVTDLLDSQSKTVGEHFLEPL